MKYNLLRFYYRNIGKLRCTIQNRFNMPITNNERKLRLLKNRYQNKRIFIIGNGPSLNKMQLSHLVNEITIGCNGIFLNFEKMGFVPTFYTVEDNLVAEDRRDIINCLQHTTKIFPYDLRYCLSYDKNSILINFARNYKRFPLFSFDFENVVFWGGTVTYMNIQLAYYLGAKEIYLIGIDHSYRVPENDIIGGSIIKSNSSDQNHFHPDYFGPGYRYHDPKVERMELAYNAAKSALYKKRVQIYNAGIDSELTVFEEIEYDSLF